MSTINSVLAVNDQNAIAHSILADSVCNQIRTQLAQTVSGINFGCNPRKLCPESTSYCNPRKPCPESTSCSIRANRVQNQLRTQSAQTVSGINFVLNSRKPCPRIKFVHNPRKPCPESTSYSIRANRVRNQVRTQSAQTVSGINFVLNPRKPCPESTSYTIRANRVRNQLRTQSAQTVSKLKFSLKHMMNSHCDHHHPFNAHHYFVLTFKGLITVVGLFSQWILLRFPHFHLCPNWLFCCSLFSLSQLFFQSPPASLCLVWCCETL